MTMKKILNEWREFTDKKLNEAKKVSSSTHFDEILGAPEEFFSKFDYAFGNPSFIGSDWVRKVLSTPEYKNKVFQAEEEDSKARKKAYSGLSYSVLEILGQDALEDVFSMKIQRFKAEYPELAEWLKNNINKVFQEASDSNMTRPDVKHKRPVAFAGQFGDWWLFNDGIDWFYNKLKKEL